MEKKRKKNEKTLEYLNSENNANICNISGWNKIKEMKYSELFERFLISKEFEDSIKELEKTKLRNDAKRFFDHPFRIIGNDLDKEFFLLPYDGTDLF